MEARKPLTPTQVEALTQERGVPRVEQLRPGVEVRYAESESGRLVRVRTLRGD
jgi:hypothetical protein